MNGNKSKRRRARLRAGLFLRRNGVYAAAGLCLALFGVIALLANGRGGAPAEMSGDETLADLDPPAPVTATETAAPTRRPAFYTAAPTEAPTAVPTVMPDMTAAPSASPAPEGVKFSAAPVDGTLLKGYSMDALVWSKTLRQWMTHSGADIRAPKGSEVYAVAAGTVTRVYTDDMMGRTVEIDHGDGLVTVYCGLKEELEVKEGDRVEARAVIGRIGDTAISECAEESHLHFEVRLDGRPCDPEGFVMIKRT